MPVCDGTLRHTKERPLVTSLEPDREPTARSTAHRPLPELAAALRSETENIVERWMASAWSVIPAPADLPADKLRERLAEILADMADVIEPANGHDVDEMIQRSPHGLARLQQRYDQRELLKEERLLRGVIIEHVELALCRRMNQAEQVALDMNLDMMLLLTQQDDEPCTAAEADFDDFNNKLWGVFGVDEMRRAWADAE